MWKESKKPGRLVYQVILTLRVVLLQKISGTVQIEMVLHLILRLKIVWIPASKVARLQFLEGHVLDSNFFRRRS